MEDETFCAGAAFMKKCSRGEDGHSCDGLFHGHVQCASERCQDYKCEAKIPLDDCTQFCDHNEDCDSGNCKHTGNLRRQCAGEDDLAPMGCHCITSNQCTTERCDDFECKQKLELGARCVGDSGTYKF